MNNIRIKIFFIEHIFEIIYYIFLYNIAALDTPYGGLQKESVCFYQRKMNSIQYNTTNLGKTETV